MSDLHTPSDRIRKTLGVDVGTPPFSVTALSLMNPVTGALGASVSTTGALLDSNGDTIAGGGGGSVVTDTIWNAKGDLAVGDAADHATRFAVGANGTVFTADSAEALGVKWAAAGAAAAGALTGATLAAGVTASSLTSFGVSPTLETPTLTGQLNGSGAISLVAGGTNTNITLTPNGTGSVVITAGASSDVFFTNDGLNDIGRIDGGRPGNLYLTENIVVGDNIMFFGHLINTNAAAEFRMANLTVNFPGDGILCSSGSVPGTFDRQVYGGVSSSFPGIKRVGTELQVTLASTTAAMGVAAVDADMSFIQDRYRRKGAGSPENAVTAPIGAIYHRTDGGDDTAVYVKISGVGNAGWKAVENVA